MRSFAAIAYSPVQLEAVSELGGTGILACAAQAGMPVPPNFETGYLIMEQPTEYVYELASPLVICTLQVRGNPVETSA
jgi:hypothetical protein